VLKNVWLLSLVLLVAIKVSNGWFPCYCCSAGEYRRVCVEAGMLQCLQSLCEKISPFKCLIQNYHNISLVVKARPSLLLGSTTLTHLPDDHQYRRQSVLKWCTGGKEFGSASKYSPKDCHHHHFVL